MNVKLCLTICIFFSDNYQCLVQLSSLPVAVCHGVGRTVDEAQLVAAHNALQYLKIMTRKTWTVRVVQSEEEIMFLAPDPQSITCDTAHCRQLPSSSLSLVFRLWKLRTIWSCFAWIELWLSWLLWSYYSSQWLVSTLVAVRSLFHAWCFTLGCRSR